MERNGKDTIESKGPPSFRTLGDILSPQFT